MTEKKDEGALGALADQLVKQAQEIPTVGPRCWLHPCDDQHRGQFWELVRVRDGAAFVRHPATGELVVCGVDSVHIAKDQTWSTGVYP